LGELLVTAPSGFLDRIVGLYREHAPNALLAIERRQTEGDLASVANAAHALKSMSLNVGATQVAQLALAVESDCKVNARLPKPASIRRL
jgi:two-component system sensor histidine kinase BarA